MDMERCDDLCRWVPGDSDAVMDRVKAWQNGQKLIVDMMHAAGDAKYDQRAKWRRNFDDLHDKVVAALDPPEIREPE